MLLVAPALWHLTSCWWCFSSFRTSSIWGSLQTVPHRTKLAESSPLTMAPWHVKVWFLATLKIFQLLLHEALVHHSFFNMLKGWHNLLGQSSWLLPSFSFAWSNNFEYLSVSGGVALMSWGYISPGEASTRGISDPSTYQIMEVNRCLHRAYIGFYQSLQYLLFLVRVYFTYYLIVHGPQLLNAIHRDDLWCLQYSNSI